MNQTIPTLTVVIPNYNHGHLIGDQLGSIFSQSVQPTRIIIIDDASTDDSISIIKRLISKKTNTKLICNATNSGGLDLANHAIHLADTEYITFLAADDMLLPGFLEKSLKLLSQHREAALCSTISLVKNNSKKWSIPNWTAQPSTTPTFLSPSEVCKMLLRVESWLMGNTTILRREPLLAVGGFRKDLMSFADEFIYRVLALRHGACFIPEPLAINIRYEGSYSATTAKNSESLEKILIKSSKYMTENYPDLFPHNLIARSNARMLFRVLSAKLDNFLSGTLAIVELKYPIAGCKMLLPITRWATQTLKLLFFCVLRFYDIPRTTLSKIWKRSRKQSNKYD